MSVTYDSIGRSYARQRRPDSRLAAQIEAALGDVSTVLNVGAGTGSYEPAGDGVVAVEPSSVMLRQRARGSAPAIGAVAEALPFRDRSFDAALAVLTIHHWSNQRRGLQECARVARQRVVLFTWDPSAEGFWLVQDYFPEILAVDRRIFPSLDVVARAFETVDVRTVPIPGDCADGFLGAFWRRPEAYLDPSVRDGISSFSRIADPTPALARLRDDLATGAWERRYAGLLDRADLDVGYRLVVGTWSNAAVGLGNDYKSGG